MDGVLGTPVKSVSPLVYTIVRNGLNYSLAFTGTNPQVLRVFLLNADASRAVVVGMLQPKPSTLRRVQ